MTEIEIPGMYERVCVVVVDIPREFLVEDYVEVVTHLLVYSRARSLKLQRSYSRTLDHVGVYVLFALSQSYHRCLGNFKPEKTSAGHKFIPNIF